ncbi:MAG: beta-ketoacyl reductase [Myxococcota bacterium]
MAVEHPALWGGMIDMQPDAEATAERHNIERLADLLCSVHHGEQIAIREQQWYAARLATRELPASEPSLELREDRSYIVAGGSQLLKLARELADRGATRLILAPASPSQCSASDVERMRTSLAATGVQLSVARVATGERGAWQQLAAELDSPVGGVVFTGTRADNRVDLGDDGAHDAIARILRQDLQWVFGLYDLCRAHSLDFMLLGSSITSLTGFRGLGHDIAVSQTIDALVLHGRSIGLPISGLNWALEQDDDSQAMDVFSLAGISPLGSDLAWLAADRLISSSLDRLMVAPVDWSAFRSLFTIDGHWHLFDEVVVADRQPGAADAGELRRHLAGLTDDQAITVLTDAISARLAFVLGLPSADSVSVEQGFFDMGMDSLMAVQLASDLGLQLECELSTVSIFEHSTVTALSRYLFGEVLGRGREPDEGEHTDIYAGLSEDELGDLLAEKLASL